MNTSIPMLQTEAMDSGCSNSCPLTGILTSPARVCGCVVNDISATIVT